MCEDKSTPPSPRAFFSNLADPEPWTKKLQLLLRNNWLKLKNRQNCCGHSGEPGCWQANRSLGYAGEEGAVR